MQRLISKYALAAHLSILATAPLFLFPFFGDAEVAKVLLWLSLSAFVWMVMEPSRREGERMHDARRRFSREFLKDPLMWFSALWCVIAAVRWCNSGVSMAYDAELSAWSLKAPAMMFFPGSAEDCGRLPFAAIVAFTVLMQGLRHALGASARMAFLFTMSLLAGIASAVAVVMAFFGSSILEQMKCPSLIPSYVGVSFGLAMLAGLVSMVAAFERRWHRIMLLFVFAVGGCAMGLVCFSPVYMTVVFTGALLLLLLYSMFYSMKNLSGSGEFKLLVVFSVSLCAGLALVYLMVPPAMVSEKLAQLLEWNVFTEKFWAERDVLSAIAMKMWFSNPWIGTGLGSYPMALDFFAADADWQIISSSQSMPLHGWWHVAAERGIAGAIMLAVPFLFLLFTYAIRLIGGISARLPHPACLLCPVVLVAGALLMFVDSSLLRPEALLIFSALMAVSASSFPIRKKRVKTEKVNG